jgi:hypothetical protein
MLFYFVAHLNLKSTSNISSFKLPFWAVLISLTFLSGKSMEPPLKVTIDIKNTSSLVIKGTSNIVSFYCTCKDKMIPSNKLLRYSKKGSKLVLYNTSLKLKTANFDCGNRQMSSNMRKALLAEKHPYIKIRIKEIDLKNNKLTTSINSWSNVGALAQITIAGKTKEVDMDVNVGKTIDNKCKFSSTTNLLMTDFGIEPPEALKGLIQVDDEIEVKLDLDVNFEE